MAGSGRRDPRTLWLESGDAGSRAPNLGAVEDPTDETGSVQGRVTGTMRSCASNVLVRTCSRSLRRVRSCRRWWPARGWRWRRCARLLHRLRARRSRSSSACCASLIWLGSAWPEARRPAADRRLCTRISRRRIGSGGRPCRRLLADMGSHLVELGRERVVVELERIEVRAPAHRVLGDQRGFVDLVLGRAE